MAKFGYGVDIGGTTVKMGCFTDSGELLRKWEIRTDTSDKGANIIPDVARSVNDDIRKNGYKREELLGIGVGVPGPAHKDGTASAVNLGWVNAPVVEPLQQLTGFTAKVENDACAAALGEMWLGSGKGYSSIVLVTLGTGVGGGIIIDGKVLSGAHGAGGEIGHITIDASDPRPCSCGSHGCFEQFASANGNVRVALDYLAETDEPSPLRSIEKLNSKILWDYALAGDKVAIEIAERFSRYLGQGLASVANTVDPEVILLGGGVSRTGQPLIDYVEKYYKEFAFPACRDTEIRIASLGNDAGIYGCVYMLL
ncbi:MAG: ROK family glucokinase [Oscillospiraceae bacterium]